MRSAHMSRRQAEAVFGGIDAGYDEVFEVQANAVQYTDAVELAEVADLLDVVDRQLADAGTSALVRSPRFTDPRRAARFRRRAGRAALRSLPARLDVVETGEAA